MRINCLGIVVMDALSRTLAGYPVPGKVAQVVTDSIRFMRGGGSANTSAALTQMGLPVALFSKVGDDPNGDFLVSELARRGVETSGVRRCAGGTTPFTYVGIHPDGDRTFIHTPGTNLTFTPADIDREALFDADFLFYHDVWVLPGIDGAPGAELLAEARGRGLVTLLDECWGLGPDRLVWELMLPHADYALPSYEEMKAIYPDTGPEELVRLLRGKGARNVVLKMGRDGCLVYAGDRVMRIPSRATEIVDTTGAGDCFNAGFVAGLAHEMPEVDAAHIGALAAAACIRHVGAAENIPSFAALLEEFRKS